MLNRILLTISFCSVYCLVQAENNRAYSDTINKMDSFGKKEGCWIEFLSKEFHIVKSADKATFYRYIRYSHGIRIDQPILTSPGCMKITLKPNDSIAKEGKVIELNGTYSLFIKNGTVLIRECVFNSGFLKQQTDYFEGEGKVYWDYTNKYQNNESSYTIKVIDEFGKLIRDDYIVLENSKWKSIKRDEN
jgi:hypothetical protein